MTLVKSRGRCRFCQEELRHTFVDLGKTPLSNSYLAAADLQRAEPTYPLHAYVCPACYLVQLEEFETPENIFSDYAYFSSYSETWLKHAETYARKMVERFGYYTASLVVEVASNDGYLLQYFKAKGIPVLGIEPARNVAVIAEAKGIPTVTKFFGEKTVTELVQAGHRADLLLGNNVLAHVPDLNDFVEGLRMLLQPAGVVTMEFPHLLKLIEGNQFDTIYHEHFSYFSLTTVERVFAAHQLVLFDVEELSTHGGSLRIYARHVADVSKPILPSVSELRKKEEEAGITSLALYHSFSANVVGTKRKLLKFLDGAKQEGKKIVGYGAPAKGNTLLNYCGIGVNYLDYTVDRSPHKQGRFLPGSHIPIVSPEKVKETKPDYLLILPWNLKDEIMEQMEGIREWGGKFVVPIPEVRVYG
jgi:2-polyprenyl-3-methyl-5-hydroxy-6-metoxy-1,4-benzoquinol methylase